ncbi:MAG: Stp1/IreP family PP2C-type Ser/Thr phosphatase [Clostridia bacterium]
MKYAYKTDIGKRAHNEDNFRIPVTIETHPFIIVADGMGGHAAGAVASELVVKGMTEELSDLRDNDLLGQLKRAIQHVNLNLYRTAQSDRSMNGMGSTLVCAVLNDKRYIAANVGDSRLYHFDGKTLEQMTTDHTLVQMLVDSGQITPAEARIHPQRNLITRAMGISLRTDIDLFDCEWMEDDILLLCSDGLYGVIEDTEIARVLSQNCSLDEMCNQLVQMALQNGGTDNITIVLALCEGGDCA